MTEKSISNQENPLGFRYDQKLFLNQFFEDLRDSYEPLSEDDADYIVDEFHKRVVRHRDNYDGQ